MDESSKGDEKSEPTQIYTKTEIIDYIRNTQRLREQKSKVSGINSWVLIGALAILVWNCAILDRNGVSRQLIESLVVLISASLLLELIFLITADDHLDKTIRLRNSPTQGANFLSATRIALFLWANLPLVAYSLLIGYKSFVTVYLVLATLVFISTVRDELIQQRGRFPEPAFKNALTVKQDLWIAGLFTTAFLGQIFYDLKNIGSYLWSLSEWEIKFLLLGFAIFWTISKLLELKLDPGKSQWLDDLEKHLVIGTIDAQEAVARIESRILGARLSKIIEDFWTEYKQCLSEFRTAVGSLQTAAEEIKQVPAEFMAERKSRSSAKIAICQPKLDRLKSLINELDSFLQLAERKSSSQKAEIKETIGSIKSQALEAKSELKQLEGAYLMAEAHIKSLVS